MFDRVRSRGRAGWQSVELDVCDKGLARVLMARTWGTARRADDVSRI